VLRHERGGDVHWDLMIADGGRLVTWRMDGPPGGTGRTFGLVRIQDHPLRFLEYVGPVQGGTGRVERVDEGVCVIMDGTIETGGVIEFRGRKMIGVHLYSRKGDEWCLKRSKQEA